jgi:flavodoxin
MNEKHNILIAYFSWSGNTRLIAKKINQIIESDLVEIKCVTPYSKHYNICIDEAKRDKLNQVKPEIKINIPDFELYNIIFLGYPNWWSSIPMPIASFLKKYDFTGKTITPFCSHGGGGLGQSISAIKKLVPHSKITEALSVYSSGSSSLHNDIQVWLSKAGIEVK